MNDGDHVGGMRHAGQQGRHPAPRIDFQDLAQRLLDRAPALVAQWLPGGRRNGREYQAPRTRDGGPGDSLSVNLVTGAWAHFASDERGRDLTSLYAYLRHGGDSVAAARELMPLVGMRVPGQEGVETVATPVRPAASQAANGEKKSSVWRAISPVPPHAPRATFEHWSRRPEDVELVAEYRIGDDLHGYVVRFRTSDGGKETLPYTWCQDDSDDRGSQKWHWKTWDEPRPLYVPAHTFNQARPVLVVEGEKCALAAHQMLGDAWDVVSWPGGGKAWDKAAWSWIAGRSVVLWADCDAKREKLSKADEAAGVDPLSRPLLPEARQPGMAAMAGIAATLVRDQACTVRLLRIPAPGAVKDGWDVADAIAEGVTRQQMEERLSNARPYVQPLERPDTDRPQARAGVGRVPVAGRSAAVWQDFLLQGRYGPLSIRENVVMALDGVPEQDVGGIDAVVGLIAFNEFSNNVVKLAPTPWGTPAGTWSEEDELLMGDWLCRHHGLPSMARGTLEEAVRMVAFRHRFHPVRQQLEGLRGSWDGTPRLATWLRRVCLEEDEFDDREPGQQYLAKVGKWLLMAMVARIMTPGCKFDYMVIFEGPQGVGKSSLARVLGGDYYADSPLNIGDKDALQNMQGVAVYEIGELDSMSRSEVTRVKAFISSQTDRFRATFDRRPKDYPRQCVFVGTTNEDHYLTDPTGNRRFWPVRVTRQVDLQWLRDNREQMLAEALHLVDAGERFHPEPDEARLLFEPQQQQRAVENAIESAIGRYLCDDGQQIHVGREKGTLVNEISLVELLGRVGIGLEKLGPGRFHEKQAAAALRKLGWTEGRSSNPGRPRVYRRPAQQDDQPRHDVGAQEERAESVCPF